MIAVVRILMYTLEVFRDAMVDLYGASESDLDNVAG